MAYQAYGNAFHMSHQTPIIGTGVYLVRRIGAIRKKKPSAGRVFHCTLRDIPSRQNFQELQAVLSSNRQSIGRIQSV